MLVTGLGAIKGFDRSAQTKNGTAEAGADSSTDRSGRGASSDDILSPSLSKSSKTRSVSSRPQAVKSQKNSRQASDPSSFESALAASSGRGGANEMRAGEDKSAGEGLTTSASKPAAAELPTAIAIATAGPQGSDTESPVDLNGDLSGDLNVDDLLRELSSVVETESVVRKDSMLTFLSRMQNEFGIQPEKVLKVFSQLDSATMKMPVEKSAQDVIGKFDLRPDELPKAERYYREMLLQTGESALNERLAGEQIGAVLGVTVSVLSEKEAALKKLDRSISDLNNAFAMRPAPPAQAATPQQAVKQTSPLVRTDGIGPTAVSAMGLGADEDVQEDASESYSLAQVLSGEAAGVRAAVSENSNDPDIRSSSPADRGLSRRKTRAANGAGQVKLATAKDADSLTRVLEDLRPQLSDQQSDQTAGQTSRPPVDQALAVKNSFVGTATGATAAAMLKQGETKSPENVQDLVRNAQLLVQKGGGEMKMELRPEGMGEVHLKVSLKDGQVAIQMLTETDTAKRALEKGLDELKTNLASHRLQVEALKVEVGTDLAKQRFDQTQQESARDQARQLAQDFMGQFRQDREGFRQGFTEGFGWKSYQPRRNPVPEPETVVAASGSANDGERRLNLVA